MEITRIALPTPFAIGDVAAYLIADDPVTLIDSGLAYGDSWDALVAGLRAHGLQPRDVKRVLLTHGHLDHYGQAARLQELGATVYMHPLEAGKVQEQPWWLAAREQVLRACGAPAAEQAIIGEVWQQGRALTLPLSEFVPLTAGQTFAFAHAPAFSVLELPGHALGHVGFLRADGVLVGGDHLLAGVSPNPIMEPLEGGGRAPTLAQFLHSLDVASALDIHRVLPGHGPEIGDHRAVAADYRLRHERRLEAMAAQVPPAGVTAYELMRQVFPRVRGWNVFLALSEVLAHVDYLVTQGRLQREATGDVERYYSVANV